MAGPLWVELSSEQEAELGRRLRARDLTTNERMRPECVRLSVRGWTAPEIASVVDRHVVTVRKALHRFSDGGLAALADAPRAGPSATLDVRGSGRTGRDAGRRGGRGDHLDAAGTGRVAAARA
ncbi:helix-turn-helix domain-containing protein [Streptomyces olivoreticuli]|uniref:helix-turn-helix domain-containing protein n=1 Tax=Streptomyces olivoreticuli TaxID=68246 RepID=UPI0013C3751F|nr:helix-turn-helix domain-containing protein [Streptomyces olivoreticuli]